MRGKNHDTSAQESFMQEYRKAEELVFKLNTRLDYFIGSYEGIVFHVSKDPRKEFWFVYYFFPQNLSL